MSALKNAIHYAEELGFKVFPIQPNGKKPAIKNAHPEGDELRGICKGECGKLGHGFRDARSDVNWIMAMGRKYPDCNWAVATGIESGVFLVDIDADDASEWWDELWLPDGEEVQTPSGGRHIYYAYTDADLDLVSTVKKIHPNLDTRGNGGYALLPGSKTSHHVDPSNADGEYVGKLTRNMPEVPEGVLAILPEARTTTRVTEKEVEGLEKPTVESEGGKRAIKSQLDILDALPRPWHKGAGYHDAKFGVACFLWRMVRSPYYAITEDQAYELFMEHAPVNEQRQDDVNTGLWNEARIITTGQAAEHPGDVPIRLDAIELLDKFPGSRIERLFWESKKVGEVKELIRELRAEGATEQEAYSISWGASAMKSIRDRDPGGRATTWGWVVDIYSVPDKAPAAAGEDIVPVALDRPARDRPTLLTDDERDIVRDYPNFIDRYIEMCQELFAEPNMPLAYLNAWLSLSSGVGDRARLYLKGKNVPLSLWGLPIAESAAGKGDMKGVFKDTTGRMRRGGFGEINLGGDASAEALNKALVERDGSVALFFTDEAAAHLRGFKDPRNFWYKLSRLALDLYDGAGSAALRVGTDAADVGADFQVTFNMWLQTTWASASSILDNEDIESGFVGRLLVAIGDPPKITDESLSMDAASEFQVSLGGINPLTASLADGVKTRFSPDKKNQAMTWGDDVRLRHIQARKDALKFISGHPQESHLRGVMLRVTENFFKGAALLALSEGRLQIEMTDLLLALKSGEYWLRDCMRLVEAIGSSEMRKQIETLVRYIAVKPRTRAEILNSSPLKNLRTQDLVGIIERCEAEGLIMKGKDDKWVMT